MVRPEEVNQEEWLCGLSDADLLDAWTRDQFRPALAELIKRYSVMVLSVCRRGCARAVDVDDVFRRRSCIWLVMAVPFGMPNDSLGGCSVSRSDQLWQRGKRIVFHASQLAIPLQLLKIHLFN